MKVIYLSKYSRLAASSRLRSFQFIPGIERAGFKVVVFPLFNDLYLRSLYQSNKLILILSVFFSYFNRLLKLMTLRKGDIVILEYELFPYFPAWIENWLSENGIKLIVDFDDAIFHNYDLNRNIVIRRIFGKKIDKVMGYCDRVVVGNKYLGERARNAGAEIIHEIPTVIDLERYKVKPDFNLDSNSELIIGWIGTFSTYKYIKGIIPVLEEISRFDKVSLYIIGVNEEIKTSLNIHFLPWSEETEVQNIQLFDVGIMPLDDTPWEKGKCGYKLIQYMACGIPVIASGIGINNEIVNHGKNGFIANSELEWKEALMYFIKNREKLREMGRNGRTTVERDYSLQVHSKNWTNILKEI